MSRSRIDKLKSRTIKHLSILLHSLIIQVIITVILGFSVLFYIGLLMDFLLFDIKVWQLILAIMLILLGYYGYAILIPVDNISFKKFGLMWEAKIQKNSLKKINGPLCPNCSCDISHTLVFNPVRKLSCSKCGNDFRIGNDDDVSKLIKNVEQIVETDLNENKSLNFELLVPSIDKVCLYVKNKAVFPVPEVKFSISIVLEGNKTELLNGYIKDLDPETEQKIENEELNSKICETLRESGLIVFWGYEYPKVVNNGYGKKEIMLEGFYLRLNKEFSATLIANYTYSIRNKKPRINNTKYEIIFKYIGLEDHEYQHYIDDCTMTVNKID